MAKGKAVSVKWQGRQQATVSHTVGGEKEQMWPILPNLSNGGARGVEKQNVNKEFWKMT